MSGTKKMTRRAMATLDAGLAAFAGAAVAFFAFAMPQDLFEALVARSGLGRVLPAAQPPLGADARWAAVAAAGVVAAALVWTIMASLGRRPAPAANVQEPAQPEPALRLRKADAHPDAPARAPILASADFGEPLELGFDQAVEVEAEPEPEPARPIPAFLVPDKAEPRVEPEALAESEAEPEPPTAPAPAPAPAPAETGGTIGDLMSRFESGLARKKQAIEREACQAPVPPVAAPAPLPAATEPVADDRVGHRLRSAIAGLQNRA